MTAPRWALMAPRDRLDEVLGDLEEPHRIRRAHHGHCAATLLSGAEALDMVFALWRERLRNLLFVAPIFARPLRQVGLGVGVGVGLLVAMNTGAGWVTGPGPHAGPADS